MCVCVFNGRWLRDISAALRCDLALNKSFPAAVSKERGLSKREKCGNTAADESERSDIKPPYG